MTKKTTPLEETFNIPSIDEINNSFSNEAIESSSEPEDDELNDVKDYLQELNDSDWDDSDIPDSEELKKQIASTQKKLKEIEEQKRQLKSLKKYHTDVDDIHSTAMTKFDEIMTVALNMEASAGSKYLASATKLLDIALNAKNSAMDREIEMAKLQLRKEKQDHDMGRSNPKDIPYDDNEEESGENDIGSERTYSRSELLNGYESDAKK